MSDTESDETPEEEPAPRARGEAQRILQRLRLLVYLSDTTQREVEERIGVSRGYLSQLLGGAVEIKLWQLLAILHAIGAEPANFFAEVFPRRRNPVAETLEDYARAGQGRHKAINLELARLFAFGIESIADFRERLERCEDVLEELTARGILDPLDPTTERPDT